MNTGTIIVLLAYLASVAALLRFGESQAALFLLLLLGLAFAANWWWEKRNHLR